MVVVIIVVVFDGGGCGGDGCVLLLKCRFQFNVIVILVCKLFGTV